MAFQISHFRQLPLGHSTCIPLVMLVRCVGACRRKSSFDMSARFLTCRRVASQANSTVTFALHMHVCTDAHSITRSLGMSEGNLPRSSSRHLSEATYFLSGVCLSVSLRLSRSLCHLLGRMASKIPATAGKKCPPAACTASSGLSKVTAHVSTLGTEFECNRIQHREPMNEGHKGDEHHDLGVTKLKPADAPA